MFAKITISCSSTYEVDELNMVTAAYRRSFPCRTRYDFTVLFDGHTVGSQAKHHDKSRDGGLLPEIVKRSF